MRKLAAIVGLCSLWWLHGFGVGALVLGVQIDKPKVLMLTASFFAAACPVVWFIVTAGPRRGRDRAT